MLATDVISFSRALGMTGERAAAELEDVDSVADGLEQVAQVARTQRAVTRTTDHRQAALAWLLLAFIQAQESERQLVISGHGSLWTAGASRSLTLRSVSAPRSRSACTMSGTSLNHALEDVAFAHADARDVIARHQLRRARCRGRLAGDGLFDIPRRTLTARGSLPPWNAPTRSTMSRS